MQTDYEQRKRYEEPFKYAAVHFCHNSGKGVEQAAAELGLRPADLRSWKRKYSSDLRPRAVTPANPLDKLQAENQALRDEIRHLKVQWDVLKTTLGILSDPPRSRQD